MINIKNSGTTAIGLLLLVVTFSMESSLFKTSLLVLVLTLFLAKLSSIVMQAYDNLQKVKNK